MEEADQATVRAAWLYYMEGLTQDRVAAQRGLTRLRVNRLLGEARASGLVGITINSRLASSLELEGELRRVCGLRDALVVPTPEDPALVPVLLGRAAGEFVSRHLQTHRVRGIGVGWGATLREAIRFVKAGARPDSS
jgi:lsr operon transcriptional repressor